MHFIDYIKGKRHGKEANKLERSSLEDAFLQEAIDGFDTVEGNHAETIARLQGRFDAAVKTQCIVSLPATPIQQPKRYRLFPLLAIAASLLLLVSISIYVFHERPAEKYIVQEKDIDKKDSSNSLQIIANLPKKSDKKEERELISGLYAEPKIEENSEDLSSSEKITVQEKQQNTVKYTPLVTAVARDAEYADNEVAETIEFDEFVVVGYAPVAKRDVTSSMASVSGDNLKSRPVNSASEMMQGKIAGVQVKTSQASPDADVQVRVRGGSSITQSSEPLYIVDGKAVQNIDKIPADKIKSVDVLKDASATAIYGARGANGVIIVATTDAKKEFNQQMLQDYFTKNARKSLCNEDKTSVEIIFAINKKGKITNLRFVSSSCPAAEKETKRILKSFPTKFNEKNKIQAHLTW
jgi:TonB-dependent SusC/RagA subfamily outer membrane receptor